MLKDYAGESDREVRVRVMEGPCGLSLRFDGYGDAIESPGGIPVLIELYEGELSVVVWDDINHDDHSHKISLEGAREELRKPVDDQVGV